VVAGNHFEPWTLDAPPGLGQDAIRQEPVMKDVVILETFCPFPLKIKGSLRDQQAPSSLDSRGSRSAHFVELSGLSVDVILSVIAIQFFATHEVLEVDMPPRFGVACVRVVIQLIRPQQHVGSLHPDAAPEMPHCALGFLCHGFNVDVLGVGGARARRVDLLVGIDAEGRRGAGRW